MTTISQVNMHVLFLHKRPISDYHRQCQFISILRKCSKDEKLSETEKYLIRELFVAPEHNFDDDFWASIMEFCQKNPFFLIGELDILLKLIVQARNVVLAPGIENSQLARDTAKELFLLRQRRFTKDMAGRNSQERTSICRNHVTTCNELRPHFDGLVIDCTTIDVSGIDFSGLDLTSVQFGRNNVNDCSFVNANVTLPQFLDVISFINTHFDDEFRISLLRARISDCEETLHNVTVALEEAIVFNDSLNSFYLISSVSGEFDLSTLLADTPDDKLHSMSFMLLNDRTINLLPEDGELSYTWCNENKDVIVNMTREELLASLHRVLENRNFYLPNEVLSLAIDHKLYMLQFSMDQLKLQLQYYNESIDSYPKEDRVPLNERFISTRAKAKEMHETLEKARVDNNRLRIQLFLADLNAPKDAELGYGPTERLIECLNLAKMISNTIVDLVGKDLSKIDFSKIDLSGAEISITPEDEKKYFPEKLIHQRYALMFNYARLGLAKELEAYIVNGNLDVNRQEPGSLRTALSYACGNGHFTLAKVLIDKYHARLDLKTAHNWTVLDFLASAAGTRSLSESFVEGYEFLEYLLEKGLRLTVHQAADIGDLEKLKGFSVEELKSRCSTRNKSVVQIAAEKGNVQLLRYLKQKMVPLDDGGDENPLWVAAELGHDAVVAELAQSCPALLHKKNANMTPIQIALQCKQFTVVAILSRFEPLADSNPQIVVALSNLEALQSILHECIRSLNNPQSGDNVMKILYFSCLYDRDSIFKFALNICDAQLVDFNYRFPHDYHRRLVDVACFAGKLNILKLLMVHKAHFDINASTSMCPSMLFVSLAKNNLAMVQYLLAEGVSVREKYVGKNALQWLMTMKNIHEDDRLEVAKTMLKMGCSVLDVDNGGNTVLHYAAAVSSSMMHLLLDAHLKQVRNADGKSVKDLADEANVNIPAVTMGF
jgi:ankyrin repeat protein